MGRWAGKKKHAKPKKARKATPQEKEEQQGSSKPSQSAASASKAAAEPPKKRGRGRPRKVCVACLRACVPAPMGDAFVWLFSSDPVVFCALLCLSAIAMYYFEVCVCLGTHLLRLILCPLFQWIPTNA